MTNQRKQEEDSESVSVKSPKTRENWNTRPTKSTTEKILHKTNESENVKSESEQSEEDKTITVSVLKQSKRKKKVL